MLPSAGYFKTILCPFYSGNESCSRPFCHYKHEKETNYAKKLSYKPTPIHLLDEKNPVSYEPTPLSKIAEDKKHDLVSRIIEESNEEFEKPKSSEKRSRSESKNSKNDSKRHRSDSKRSEKDSKRHKSDSKRSEKDSNRHKSDSKNSERNSKSSKSDSKRSEKDIKRSKSESSDSDKSKKSKNDSEKGKNETIPDSVLSFLDQMDEIDKKLKPKEKKVVKKNSFLSEISKVDEKIVETSKKRISLVKPSEQGESSFSIARKKQPNNPVTAMLNRIQKARIESQTKDIEDQLSALEDIQQPSTSKKPREMLEGIPFF